MDKSKTATQRAYLRHKEAAEYLGISRSLLAKQIRLGATPLEAMKAAGHTRVDTTMLYTLTDAVRERQQVERMFEWLIGDAAAGKPQ